MVSPWCPGGVGLPVAVLIYAAGRGVGLVDGESVTGNR